MACLSHCADPLIPCNGTDCRGDTTWGLDMAKGGIADMRELGIRESFKSKLQVLQEGRHACSGVYVGVDMCVWAWGWRRATK